MATSTTLGSIVREVLEAGGEKTLDQNEQNQFYREFYSSISSTIEEIRNDQRRAFEERKNLIVA